MAAYRAWNNEMYSSQSDEASAEEPIEDEASAEEPIDEVAEDGTAGAPN